MTDPKAMLQAMVAKAKSRVLDNKRKPTGEPLEPPPVAKAKGASVETKQVVPTPRLPATPQGKSVAPVPKQSGATLPKATPPPVPKVPGSKPSPPPQPSSSAQFQKIGAVLAKAKETRLLAEQAKNGISGDVPATKGSPPQPKTGLPTISPISVKSTSVAKGVVTPPPKRPDSPELSPPPTIPAPNLKRTLTFSGATEVDSQEISPTEVGEISGGMESTWDNGWGWWDNWSAPNTWGWNHGNYSSYWGSDYSWGWGWPEEDQTPPTPSSAESEIPEDVHAALAQRKPTQESLSPQAPENPDPEPEAVTPRTGEDAEPREDQPCLDPTDTEAWRKDRKGRLLSPHALYMRFYRDIRSDFDLN